MAAMLRHTCDYAQAANSALESTASDFSVVEGQAWDAWIAALMKFAEDNGFPTSNSPVSEFVRFVEVLQAILADELELASEATRMSQVARARLNDEIARYKALTEVPVKSITNLVQAIARALKDAKKRASAQAKARRIADAERQAEAERFAAEESRREKERALLREAVADLARLRHNRRLARRGQSPETTGV
jgi:hypothetical protein